MADQDMADADRVGLIAATAGRRWPARVAARLGDRAVTFESLHRWSETVARDLGLGGVAGGDTVMIMLPNCLEVLAVTLAAWRIGAVAVPVVPIYRAHETGQIVADARPAAVVTSERLGERSPMAELDVCLAEHRVDPRVRYVVATGGSVGTGRPAGGSVGTGEPVGTGRHAGGAAAWPSTGWRAVPAPDDVVGQVRLPEPAPPQAECLRLYTSGTTSAPKGARLASPALLSGARKFRSDLGLADTDIGLALAPVTHIAGLLAACLVPLTCGVGAVLLPKWDLGDAVDAIHRHRATWSLGAAVFLKDLVEEYERRADNPHRLTYFVSGGASTAPNLVERADRLGIRAMRTYGMTETAGPVTLAGPAATLEQRAYLDGPVVDGLEVQVVDDEATPLPAGAEGHIRIRGQQVMLGYSDPHATSAAMVDGWFYPGDLGRLNADGWIRITGRTKDIINRGGEKLSAADIEAALHRHPGVSSAAVVGVPHERLGEVVGAFVVARPGAEPLTGERLAEFLHAEGLAKVKIPQRWHFLDTLPTTATGKVQKHLLRDAAR